jgi:DNA-damage-inducible protein J
MGDTPITVRDVVLEVWNPDRITCRNISNHREMKRAEAEALAKVANAISSPDEPGTLPFTLTGTISAHDTWFRRQVRAALDDTSPAIRHDEVKAYFADRRVAALRKATTEGNREAGTDGD